MIDFEKLGERHGYIIARGWYRAIDWFGMTMVGWIVALFVIGLILIGSIA